MFSIQEIFMQFFLKTKGGTLTARLMGGAFNPRHFVTIVFGALSLVQTAPGAVSGRSETSIDLSLMVARSRQISAMDPGTEIRVVLTLPLGDAPGAAAFVHSVADPRSPLYHKYLTPEEFAQRFGASTADYAGLKQWAIVNGLTITQESIAHTTLTIHGTVAQFQALFKTQLDTYQSADGKSFYSASVAPTIPEAIASKIDGVIGLTESVEYAPLAKVYKTLGENPVTPADRIDTSGGTGPGGAFAASDLRTAYQIPAFGGLMPQTVAVFEQGGFFKSDVEKYVKTMGLAVPEIKVVGVNGYNGAVNSADVELEAVLDIDMVIGMNPAVSEVLVYEDGFLNEPFAVEIVDSLERVAADNQAQTLSISYGVDEVQQTDAGLKAENRALTQLAAQGITVLVASGDNGAYGRTGASYYPAHLEAPDPGSQPLVTCVGGTSLFTGPGQLYNGENVWNDLGVQDGATGGGVSSYWLIPAYQPPAYVDNNGGSATMRNVPDVAAVGNPLTGVAVYSKINGGWLQIGGTSVSTPLWAGYISVLNAGLEYLIGSKIGQFNPILYRIGPSAGYLYPIDNGSNGNVEIYGTPGYNAGNFYDPYSNCCGNGSIYGGAFTYALLLSETASGTPPGNFFVDPIKAQRTTATISWTPASSATGYLVTTSYGTEFFGYATAYITKERTIKVNNLLPATDYSVAVDALNAEGATEVDSAFLTK
jgi:subtilase family serine protease